jgi:hypothetical protein
VNPPRGWTNAKEMFVLESNRIERIMGVSVADRTAHARLWAQDPIRMGDVEEFVRAVAGRELRSEPGMDVYITGVGFTPPPGGSDIAERLSLMLDTLDNTDPYDWHVAYETLHPFMDGNGRSGRALWAWQMVNTGIDPFGLGFLHTFYYQALDAGRR